MNESNAPATYQLPEQMSTVSGDIDWLYYFPAWTSVVLFVAIVGAMIYWAIKYRERPGHKSTPTGHNMPLEIAWTVAPIFILAFLFHKGFQGYMDLAVAPGNSIEIRVNAKQWSWEFVYPNGGSSPELHVPEGKPVKLVLTSADVLHSFFVPALRVKRDVVPGMFTTVWFQTTHVGHDDIACAEYCGGRSTGANGELPYEPSDDPGKPCPADIAAEQGQKIYSNKGCLACHTTTGVPGVGPSWKGIWGKEEATNVGKVKIDENYIRESILDPQAKIVTGFGPVMPTFRGQISDQELNEVIAYIESLK